MSPELIHAIKERIINGRPKEDIKHEVLSLGYNEELFEAAYTLASHDAENESHVATTTVQLSSIHTLIKKAFFATLNTWGMIVLILVPLLILLLLTELGAHFEHDLLLTGVFSGLSIVVMFFYLINIMVVLFLVSRESALERNTYQEGFHWVKRNFFGFIFVYLLTVLAVWGGFVLFVIPGFFLLISLYFSQYIFVLEGKRGMSALLRSRAIVKGRWFTVLWKVIGLALYFIIPVFLAGMIVGIVDAFYPLSQFRIGGEIIIQIASAFFMVISMRVMFVMYRELAAGVVDTPPKKSTLLTHWLIVALGIVIIPIILILMFFYNGVSTLKDNVPLPKEDASAPIELRTLETVASEYHAANGLFTNVCQPLIEAVGNGEGTECNASETAWALSIYSFEQRWCVDSSNPSPKRIQAELGENTECVFVK